MPYIWQSLGRVKGGISAEADKETEAFECRLRSNYSLWVIMVGISISEFRSNGIFLDIEPRHPNQRGQFAAGFLFNQFNG